MPILVVWDNDEKTILRYDIRGRWTWDEMMNAYNEGAALLKEVSHTVDFIVYPIDPISKAHIPPNSLSNVLRLHGKSLSNAGVTALINDNTTARTLLRLLSALNPRIAARYIMVDTLEEARQKLDSKLKNERKESS